MSARKRTMNAFALREERMRVMRNKAGRPARKSYDTTLRYDFAMNRGLETIPNLV